ncbi:sensor histidine kinase [Paludibacterium yongneupense]|uniref:sensor histidine kinase n=1 Tax=Paludibacterium yongneupense TaxID=400061 RepID=UPI0003FF004F|nr:ATP-binding protein [Paludibacterium yongneupense]
MSAKLEVADERTRLLAEIERQNRVIEVLMDKVEGGGEDSELNLFQATLMLEDQVKARTHDLHAALLKNEQANRDLQRLTDELKQSQTELLRHQAHLSELVTEQTHDLVRAIENAEAASRAKTEFLATMSHELRTPINGVVGMTDLALGTRLDSQQRSCLEVVKSSADALLHIIDTMLDYAAVESGKLVFVPVAIDLPRLLAETARIHQASAQDKNLALRLEVDPDFPAWILGDPGRWRQIMTVLLDNAIKFTARGTIDVRLEAASGAEGPYGVLTVRDSGIGIESRNLSRIFEPFTQADSSSTRRFGGTGLGLSLAKQLVAVMDGEIVVHSEPGNGSTFTVRVPLTRCDPPRDEAVFSLCDAGFDYRHALMEAEPQTAEAAARTLLERVELLPALHQAVLAADRDEAQRTALVLKDLFLGLGAIPAARLSMVIAAQARSGQMSNAEGKIGDLEAEFTLLLPLLKEK